MGGFGTPKDEQAEALIEMYSIVCLRMILEVYQTKIWIWPKQWVVSIFLQGSFNWELTLIQSSWPNIGSIV